MKQNRVDVGEENFEALRNNNGYYVDKTELLYELFEKTSNKVSLFTRPRRFGKTLMMSMIENFFNVEKDSHDLFDGLAVSKHKDFYKGYMNQYPVIFLSLKTVEGLTFNDAYEQLTALIGGFCDHHRYLLKDKNVTEGVKLIFNKLCLCEATKTQVKNSLKTLTEILYSYYGKKVIILIDEYDVPLAKAEENGYYREMLDLMRGMLNAALKGNNYLQSAVLTGCLRIPKESIFTGVNHFVSYSVISRRFASYFGFTGDEVHQLLKHFDLADHEAVIRDWYDGYRFGDHEIYCPWDVISYVSELLNDPDARPQNYWENSSHNSIIDHFLKQGKKAYKKRFEALMNGGSIQASVTDSLTYNDMYALPENIWSLLLMTGYLTANKKYDEWGNQTADLRIPNKEIQNIFQKAVNRNFEETADQGKVENLMQALWNRDEAKATEILSDLLWSTISYMDYSESYYHAFLTGIFVGRGYDVESNKELGLGRPDIVIDDNDNRRAIVIEAKRADHEERMGYWCDQAISQIADRGYDQGFDGYKEVLSYGVAFFKKKALVKLKKDNR